ncbi:zona pellucida-like domain-containing protein 1 isoform X2 [Gouania willdenowi]|uniref:zona pellucida-like domain-containing protein 1 isoform X2 n=1 Tax=Gouania willdenowi TaxID=441366 RepID=UPI001055AF91|nr:zona pellucida-like domain-containing protein 1 isoform X2 [Gouania willdenowi]
MMRLIIIMHLFGVMWRTNAQTPSQCIADATNRPPESSDMTVLCGTTHMEVSIYICPVYNAQYNESLMVLNNQVNNPECYGTPDMTATPPVLRFRFPINESSSTDCENDLTITNQVGTGIFSSYSNVPFVNISGSIVAIDPSAGQITYREQIIYKYSCNYPMQYLINNTELAVSGVKVAIKDNNGSFITTLSMALYKDQNYSTPLDIPTTGLNLKTKIYVAVTATNLTERFHVMLDRCYTTTGPFQTQSSMYDLFVGCPSDPQTVIELNGDAQQAHFSFEAFRFVEHRNLTVSTFFLHCTTRLCDVTKCEELKPDCSTSAPGRRRREASGSGDDGDDGDDSPTEATITSGPISVNSRTTTDVEPISAPQSTSKASSSYDRREMVVIHFLAVISFFIIL